MLFWAHVLEWNTLMALKGYCAMCFCLCNDCQAACGCCFLGSVTSSLNQIMSLGLRTSFIKCIRKGAYCASLKHDGFCSLQIPLFYARWAKHAAPRCQVYLNKIGLLCGHPGLSLWEKRGRLGKWIAVGCFSTEGKWREEDRARKEIAWLSSSIWLS